MRRRIEFCHVSRTERCYFWEQLTRRFHARLTDRRRPRSLGRERKRKSNRGVDLSLRLLQSKAREPFRSERAEGLSDHRPKDSRPLSPINRIPWSSRYPLREPAIGCACYRWNDGRATLAPGEAKGWRRPSTLMCKNKRFPPRAHRVFVFWLLSCCFLFRRASKWWWVAASTTTKPRPAWSWT